VPGAPAGRAANANDFERTSAGGFPEAAGVERADTPYMGFGLEGITGADARKTGQGSLAVSPMLLAAPCAHNRHPSVAGIGVSAASILTGEAARSIADGMRTPRSLMRGEPPQYLMRCLPSCCSERGDSVPVGVLIEVRADGRQKGLHVGDAGLRSICADIPSVSSGYRYEQNCFGTAQLRRQVVHEEPDAVLIVPHDRVSEGSTRLCQAPPAHHPRTDGHTLRCFIYVEGSVQLVPSRPSRMRLRPNRNSLL
jgi:hypothetical protein